MIRRGRQQCEAHRRDGQRCQAPAVEGHWVCLHHGGAARQVRIAARRMVLLEAYAAAVEAWQAAGPGIPGELTPRQFDLLCKAAQAQRALEEYEVKLAAIAALRAQLRRQAMQRADPMQRAETA